MNVFENYNRLCFLWKRLNSRRCMIKTFPGGGGAEIVTPSNLPPPHEQLLPLLTPYFKMFFGKIP